MYYSYLPFLLGFLSVFSLRAQVTEKGIVQAANQFIQLLDKDQQLKALNPFISDERYNFHFVPREDRKGIVLRDLSASQRSAAMQLLKMCLSADAFQKTTEITQLETVLKELEKRPADDHYRDPGKYFIAIFGTPGTTTTWGWRFEGHHVSFNFSTLNDKLVAGTPGFLGSNPAIVPDGPQKGKQILKEETELGYELLQSFDASQLNKVVMDSIAPNDIFTFDKRKALFDKSAGITYSEMTAPQREIFLRLVGLYIHRYTRLFADDMIREIRQVGLEALRFAWAGKRQIGMGNKNYYRIQGPTLIIEYDNTQNNGNHIHSVVRDLLHDFGGDELLEHYKADH